jgi:molybdate transport system substrate-binding protein
MEDIAEDFEKNSGIRCEVITASSGKLFAQIREGAPFDIFMSADMAYPESLYKAGLSQESPEVYAYGTLVLWTCKSGVTPSLEILRQRGVERIAVANPKTAPYGKAALQVLEYYGLLPILEDKLVYGESVAQAGQFISTGAAEIGFTSQALVRSPALENKGQWIALDQKAYDPLPHGVVILGPKEEHKPEVKIFYKYIFSRESRELLEKFGYSVNE